VGNRSSATLESPSPAAQPTRQLVRVEEIGALAVFLCSDAAASINSAALPIDGGWVAQ
jgi:3-hydroxybutyrate dehydrogenase